MDNFGLRGTVMMRKNNQAKTRVLTVRRRDTVSQTWRGYS
jgi:hypothetical protein